MVCGPEPTGHSHLACWADGLPKNATEKRGTDGKVTPFEKSPLVMDKTGLFKEYEKTSGKGKLEGRK